MLAKKLFKKKSSVVMERRIANTIEKEIRDSIRENQNSVKEIYLDITDLLLTHYIEEMRKLAKKEELTLSQVLMHLRTYAFNYACEQPLPEEDDY